MIVSPRNGHQCASAQRPYLSLSQGPLPPPDGVGVEDDDQQAQLIICKGSAQRRHCGPGAERLRPLSPHPALCQDYSKCKEIMIERGEIFLTKVSLSRNKIAKLCHPFIRDGARILTHAYSRVVLRVLEAAVEAKKRFSVYVTESQPDEAGQKMAKALRKLNIPVTVILDAAVGYIMEKVDLVLVGAEGVVESGGIINKIGTNQIAVCAKAQNKPFYVVAESFKFVRLFPLNQQDVPDRFKYKADTLKTSQNLKEEHPWIDYTSPSLITLLFTDLGVLTPSAVSDELIKLYL
ncbi:translation initiation factor eIF-2B subunit alpha [Geospiza fortis]|uniref:Translation initiation factor eIF-2B subunit alpha n=1 Tax=Geospiza fortis TaxID=48883 RepID=A0A6I9Z6R6_GEOFO|nr:translation initiation factor eIF-2B subunit alpha [Geospiza fortis]